MTSTCVRCSGKDGAHYMECVVGRLFERVMGPGYPWKAPVTPVEPGPRTVIRPAAPSPEWEEAYGDLSDDFVAGVGVGRAMEPTVGPPNEAEWQREAERQKAELLGETPAPSLLDEPVPSTALPLDYYDRLRDEAEASTSPDRDEVVDVDVPALIDEIQRKHNLTKAQIAALVGASGPSISNWANGRTTLMPKYLKALLRLRDRPASARGAEVRPPQQKRDREAFVARAEEERERVAPWVRKFADDCLILGNPSHNGSPWTERGDWVPSAQLHEAYNEWAAMTPDAPELTGNQVSMGMGSLGYKTRQAIVIGESKPALFFGVILRPKPNWGEPRASEVAEQQAGGDVHTAKIRALMKQAPRTTVIVKDEQPEPAPEPAPEPERAKTNNGWDNAPTSGNTSEEPALTLEQLEAENAAIATRKRRTFSGVRPGREIPKEYRDLINPLLDLPGWRYAPHNANGKGKPRIWNPKGKMFCLPNTPSDVKGLLACKTMLKNSLGAPL